MSTTIPSSQKPDLCFLNERDEGVVPFRVMGECSGINTLAQKVVIMLLTKEGDPGRSSGTRLPLLLTGANAVDGTVRNVVTQAAARVKSALTSITDVPAEERLKALTVNEVSVISTDSVSVSLTVESHAESTTIGVRIPLVAKD